MQWSSTVMHLLISKIQLKFLTMTQSLTIMQNVS